MGTQREGTDGIGGARRTITSINTDSISLHILNKMICINWYHPRCFIKFSYYVSENNVWGTEAGAQATECVHLAPYKQDMVVPTCHPNTLEVEARGSEVSSHFQLHREFEVSLEPV